MSHTIAPIASHAAAPRDTLCAQAARVLSITAKQWGMCTASAEVPKSPAALQRKASALPCLALHQWALNPWAQPA